MIEPIFGLRVNPGMGVMLDPGGGAGGGSAGQVDYPEHIKAFHTGLLVGDVDAGLAEFQTAFDVAGVPNYLEAVAAATAANPYTLTDAYDPATDLGAIQTRHDDVDTLISAIDLTEATGNIADYVAAAVTLATTALPDSEIDAAVASFEARSLTAFQRQVGRVTAGMFEQRAIMNTQLDMALANMEQDRAIQVDDMDSRLRLLTQQERYQAKLQLVAYFLQLLDMKLMRSQQAVAQQFDISKLNIVAYQDQILSDISLDEKDVLWDLDILKYGQNALSSISGSVVPKAPTPQERLVAAVSNSAAAGLQIGTALGNPAAGFAGGLGFLALQLIGGLK